MRSLLAASTLAVFTFGTFGCAVAGSDTEDVYGAAIAPLPVPYTLLAGAIAELADPNSPPPGANDFSCVPSAKHPEPVILLHGTVANQTDNWQTLSPLLKNQGFCVFTLTYGARSSSFPLSEIGGLVPMEQSAEEISGFIDDVLAATKAKKVDLVGHSQGGVLAASYVKQHGGAGKVSDVVTLGAPLRGTNTFNLDFLVVGLDLLGLDFIAEAFEDNLCASCTQFLASSQFVKDLNAGGTAAVSSVRYTNIVTIYDELVVPYTKGTITDSPGVNNVTNIVLQDHCWQDFAEHLKLAADFNAVHRVVKALDPSYSVPSCAFVTPFI